MTKFCPECGTQQREDDAKFCSNCGFDFSKIENNQGSTSINQENSNVNKSDEAVNAISKKNKSSDVPIKVIDDSKKSSTSSQNNNHSNNANNSNFLSNLSFNKCFLAFAIILIVLFIIGMISQATDTEPYSDNGITSFMESSGNYDMNSFLGDNGGYVGLDDSSDDSSDDYSNFLYG